MKLRGVEFKVLYEYDVTEKLELKKGQIYKGLFHGFFQEGNLNDGVDMFAMIELENGKVFKYFHDELRFLDESKEE